MAKHRWTPAEKAEPKKSDLPAKDKAEEKGSTVPAFQRTKNAAMRYSPKRAVRG